MNKRLSIILAASLLAVPLSVSANAQQSSSGEGDCKLAGLLGDILSEKINCDKHDGDEKCSIKDIILDKIFEKTEDLRCEIFGDCGDSHPDIEPDAPVPEKPDVPDLPVIPDIDETPDSPGEDNDNIGNDTENMSQVEMVVALVNKYRAENGLSPVSADSQLNRAAAIRSSELPTLFSHTRPDGTRCFTVLDQLSISYRGAGENIASGQTSAQQVMDDWMNSSGHRANILGANFKNIGVGLHIDDSGRYHWTQLFTY